VGWGAGAVLLAAAGAVLLAAAAAAGSSPHPTSRTQRKHSLRVQAAL